MVKICSKCGAEKPLSEFYTRPGGRDGVRADCKACVVSRSVRWGKANLLKRQAHSAQWRHKNPEAAAAAIAAWQKANPERRAKNGAAWAQAHPEKIRAAVDKWRASNPEQVLAAAAQRRAAQLNATPAWANLDEIRRLYDEAARLTRETGVKHHVDHIVPLRAKLVSGLHVHNNLQVLPAAVNMAKGNRYWPDMPGECA